MKRLILGAIIFSVTISILGCTKNEQEIEYIPESLVGYIFIEDDEVLLDEVEIIHSNDLDRIEELGLTIQNDLPSGYHIYNAEAEKVTLQITDDTKYIFTDFNLLFETAEIEDRIYETTEINEFIEGSSYQDVPLEQQKIPYFLEVYNGKVSSITEDFMYTQ